MSGRLGPTEQFSGYRLNGRLRSLLQHRIDDHRLFLALRNAGHPVRFRPESSRYGWGELRGTEGVEWEEGED